MELYLNSPICLHSMNRKIFTYSQNIFYVTMLSNVLGDIFLYKGNRHTSVSFPF